MLRTVQGVQSDRGPRRDPAAPPKPAPKAPFDPKASLARDAVNGQDNGSLVWRNAQAYMASLEGAIGHA